MSAAPPPGPGPTVAPGLTVQPPTTALGVPWYTSQRFTALWQQAVISFVGWLLVALTTNVWDWRTGLVVPLLSTVLVTLKDWWSPTVAAPASWMNRRNTGPTQ